MIRSQKKLRDNYGIHICIFPVYENNRLKIWHRAYAVSEKGVIWNGKEKIDGKSREIKFETYQAAEKEGIKQSNKYLKQNEQRYKI